MAIVSCAACQKKLKVADTSLGKKVKCSCGHVFVAEAEGLASTPTPVAAAEAMDKVIVACTECGSKLKVAATSLGKKMKCPKCAAVFVAATDAPKPVIAAPVMAAPVADDDDLMAFAQADVNDENDTPKAKKGNAPPPMVEDDEEEEPTYKSKAKPEPKRSVPAKADAPKKYPSRILVNLFVFFLLFLFIGFFVGVYLFMEDESFVEPKTTNRKYLEGFGWPMKDPPAKAQGPNQLRPGGGKGQRQGDDKGKVIATDNEKAADGDKNKAVDGEKEKANDPDPKNKDDAGKDENIGAAKLTSWQAVALTTSNSVDEKREAGLI